jgi:dipeptidyl aminopeptidase/acylaminoacyl peptidase
MSDEHRFERDARAWLELGPTDAPDRVVEAALYEIEQTEQERGIRIPWRNTPMKWRLGLAAAALVVAVTAGLIYLNLPGRNGDDVGAPSATPTLPAPTPTPRLTAVDYSNLPGWIVFERAGKAPDGSTPAGVEYPHSLWLVHADGSNMHELAPGLPASGKVSFDISPDGSQVIFSAFDSPVLVWEVGIEGGDPALLSTDCSGVPAECMDAAPAYSPDGKRIAFLRATEASSVLAIRDLASGAVTLLEATQTSSSDVWLAEPSWSPDGAQIVYHKVNYDDAQDKVVDTNVFIVNADGTGLHELALPDGTPWGDPDWSPDGSRLVLGSYPIREFGSGEAEVYSVRPDGTDLQQLSSLGVGSGAASWTSDGAHIFFWGFQTFFLMDPDGGNARAINQADLVFHNDGYGFYGLLQPTNP